MRILVGVFRMVSLLTYSLWVLFVAYTKFQRVDKKEQGRMIKEYNCRILAMAGVKQLIPAVFRKVCWSMA